jgi:hypothetical protein
MSRISSDKGVKSRGEVKSSMFKYDSLNSDYTSLYAFIRVDFDCDDSSVELNV